MSKSTRNTGKEWTREEVKQLRELAAEYTPTRVIGVKLKRTPDAIYSKAAQKGISLGTRKTSRD
jgi:HEPN domain-containing protein